MGLFDGMKDRLGFGSKPEWQEDEYYDQPDDGYAYDEGYQDEAVQDDSYASDGYGSSGGHEVVSFDAYNPNKFEHVTLSGDSSPKVASSYDDLAATSPSSSFTSRESGFGGTGSRSVGTVRPASERPSPSRGGVSNWSTPDDPSFLDRARNAVSSRDESRSSGLFSGLGSDFLNASKDPASHLEIIKPVAYADVEKIANAAKSGKSTVLVVEETKPALAKRILDFSFGVASALNLNVDKAAERVFIISKGSEMLTSEEREYLNKQGVLK